MSIGYMNAPDLINIASADYPSDLTIGSNTVLWQKTATYPMEIYDFFAVVTTLTAGSSMLALRKTPKNGTPSANLATITIPTASPVNAIFRNILIANNRLISLQIGDAVTCWLILAATAGGAAVSVLGRRVQQPILNAAAIPNYTEVVS